MKKMIQNYIINIDNLIKENKINNKVIEEHLIKIKFFQHERLIHLLVTLFFALFTFISIGISFENELFCFVTIILVLCLIPYVFYYFFLENNIQYLYEQYDKMIKK